jgi:hypothetical protein
MSSYFLPRHERLNNHPMRDSRFFSLATGPTQKPTQACSTLLAIYLVILSAFPQSEEVLVSGLRLSSICLQRHRSLPVLTTTTLPCFPARRLVGRRSAMQHRRRTSIYPSSTTRRTSINMTTTTRKREWFDDESFWRELYTFMFRASGATARSIPECP